MSLNLYNIGQSLFNKSMTDSKIQTSYIKVLKTCNLYPKEFLSIHSIAEDLRETTHQSITIIKGQIHEQLIKEVIRSTHEFKLIEPFIRSKISMTLPNSVLERVANLTTEFNTGKISRTDITTFNKVLKDFFYFVKNEPNTNCQRFEGQLDLVFQNLTTRQYYYYEISTRNNHCGKQNIGSLMTFLRNYAYLIKKLNINNFEDLKIGNIFILEKETFKCQYMPNGKNAAISFKTFCKDILNDSNYEIYNSLLTSVRACEDEYDADNLKYRERIAELFLNDFYDTDFTRTQFFSKLHNKTKRIIKT